MALPKAKVELSPNCKPVFLEHVFQINKVSREETRRIHVFKCFKSLVISKSFLYSSRHFDTYRLNLVIDSDEQNGLKFICSMASEYSSIGWLGFRLKFEKAKSLMRLLLPKFFGVHYQDGDYNGILFNQAADLMQITGEKICLSFGIVPNEIPFLFLVRKFAKRIHELTCNASIFDDPDLPKLTLDSAYIGKFESIGQLKRILRHDIKKLDLWTISTHYAGDAASNFNDESNQLIQNTCLKTAKLSIIHCKYGQMKDIVGNFLGACPNLNHLDVNMSFSAPNHEFDVLYVVDQTLAYRRLLDDVKTLPFGHIPKVPIKFSVDFTRWDDEYDHSWFEELKTRFNGWTVKSDYDYSDFDELNSFHVHFKLDDDRFPLNFEVALEWTGEENEQLALEYPSDDTEVEMFSDGDNSEMESDHSDMEID